MWVDGNFNWSIDFNSFFGSDELFERVNFFIVDCCFGNLVFGIVFIVCDVNIVSCDC